MDASEREGRGHTLHGDLARGILDSVDLHDGRLCTGGGDSSQEVHCNSSAGRS